MTKIERAILSLQDDVRVCEQSCNQGVAHYALKKEAYKRAIAALTAQAERENPNPLTVEQLRGMDGEPVWVDWGKKQLRPPCWALVEVGDGDIALDAAGLVIRSIESVSMCDGAVYAHKPSGEVAG